MKAGNDSKNFPPDYFSLNFLPVESTLSLLFYQNPISFFTTFDFLLVLKYLSDHFLLKLIYVLSF